MGKCIFLNSVSYPSKLLSPSKGVGHMYPNLEWIHQNVSITKVKQEKKENDVNQNVLHSRELSKNILPGTHD